MPDRNRVLVIATTYAYRADGTLTAIQAVLAAYGPAGNQTDLVELSVPSWDGLFDVWAVARDGAGNIVLAGTLDTLEEGVLSTEQGWAIRVRPDLSVDPCFGEAGDGVPIGNLALGAAAGPLADGSVVFANYYWKYFTFFASGD